MTGGCRLKSGSTPGNSLASLRDAAAGIADLVLSRLRELSANPLTGDFAVELAPIEKGLQTLVAGHTPVHRLARIASGVIGCYHGRSNAGGRPSCLDVSFPAFEIEEFVRSLLSSNTWRQDDPDNPAQAEEFCAAWNELNQRMQRASLAKVLKEFRFNLGKGTVQLSLAEDAVQRLKSRPS